MKNEKSTFSVLFYLKKDKMKKNGLVPIHARITINGKQTQFNTKLEVSSPLHTCQRIWNSMK